MKGGKDEYLMGTIERSCDPMTLQHRGKLPDAVRKKKICKRQMQSFFYPDEGDWEA